MALVLCTTSPALVVPSAFVPSAVVSWVILELLPDAVCETVFTVLVMFVELVSPLFERTVLIDVIDALLPSTVCDRVLNVDVSTFSDMSPSASVILVSRLVARDFTLVSSESVLVMKLDTVLSNDSIEVILPSAVSSLCKALVTSLSLISCHEYVPPLFVNR